MPAVTIVIPAYNAAGLVESAIQSALAQTYRDFEILVVDDGSTDETSSRAGAFGDPVRVLNVPHGGLASARNHGIRAAAGRFIVFLDADDILEKPLVARAVDFLERRPDLAFVFCNVRLFYDGGALFQACIPPAVVGGQSEAVVTDPLPRFLGSGYPISSSGLCARREALLEAGLFDETLWGSEDFEYWSRLYLRRPIGYLAEPLVRIRRHEGNMTRQPGRMIHSMAASRAKVIANCLKFHRADLVPTVRQFARYHMAGAARDVLTGGDSSGARTLLWRYRRELLGFRWLVLMGATLVPGGVLRGIARVRSWGRDRQS